MAETEQGNEMPSGKQPLKETTPVSPASVPSEQGQTKETNVDVSEHTMNGVDPAKLGILSDVSISLTIEVGRAQIKISDLLALTKGSVIELNKSAGDPVDIYANGKLISIGNIITVNGKYCVKLTAIPENSHVGVHLDGK